MNKDTELIFNLFIMVFWSDHSFGGRQIFETMSESGYAWNIKNNQFKLLKDCFPENEYCFEGLQIVDSTDPEKVAGCQYSHNVIKEKVK